LATFVARGPSLRRSPASAASALLLRLLTPAVSPARPEEGLTWPQGRGDAPLLHLPLGAGMTRLLVLGRSRLETSSASLFPCPALPLDGTDAPLSRAAPGHARPAMPPPCLINCALVCVAAVMRGHPTLTHPTIELIRTPFPHSVASAWAPRRLSSSLCIGSPVHLLAPVGGIGSVMAALPHRASAELVSPAILAKYSPPVIKRRRISD
jgi:hypothetical protein